MKTTKLFTTLAAFVLVLGLGACDLTQDETLDEGGETTETSEPSESTEQTGGETTELSNYTVSFTFVDASEEATTIPDYATAYIIGDWDNWGAFLPLTEDEGVYSYTFTSIEVGTHEFKGVMWYTDDLVSWTNCVEIITGENGGNVNLVVSEDQGDDYTQTIQVTLTETLEEKGEPVVTYVITIGSLSAAPDGIILYAAGDFNGTKSTEGDWYEWGNPVALKNNNNATYDLVLYELPEVGRSFEIIVDDTTDETQDMWQYILGSHTFTTDDVDTTGGTTKTITVETSYTSWTEDGGVFPPLGEEEEFYVLFVDGNGASTWNTTLYFGANTEIWNGTTQSSATQTKAGDGHFAFYSEEASAPKGTVLSFEISDGGGTNIQNMNDQITNLPDNSQGTPVFVAYMWLNDWIGSQTNPWTVTVDFHTDNGWSYLKEGQTIAQFAANYTAGNYW